MRIGIWFILLFLVLLFADLRYALVGFLNNLDVIVLAALLLLAIKIKG